MFRELLSSRKHSLLYDAIDEVLSMVEKAERMYQEASSAFLDGAPEPDIARGSWSGCARPSLWSRGCVCSTWAADEP